MKPDQLRGGPAVPSPLRRRPLKRRRARLGLAWLLIICLSLVLRGPALAADGALDPSFITGPGPFAGIQTIPGIHGQVFYTNGPFNGYSLIFGQFPGLALGVDTPYSCLVRLTPTGALDTTFNNGQAFGEVRSVYLYPHDDPNFPDKILIGGAINYFSESTAYHRFFRLEADGSVDTSFPHAFEGEGAVNSFAVQGSGTTAKILVGGWSLMPLDSTGPYCSLVRLNYDGNLDDTYTPWSALGGYVGSIKVLDDNNVRIRCSYPKNSDGSGGTYYMVLLDPDLNLSSPVASIGDETVDGPIFNFARQTDGKWIIVGEFQHVYNSATSGWVARNRVARLGSDLRTLDTAYDVGVGPDSAVTQVSPMASGDDRMVLAGNFRTWNSAARGYLIRLTTSGTRDGTFNNSTSGADDRIMHVNWFSDGSGGMIYGYFHSYNGQPRGGIAGLNADGSLNSAYAGITANQGFPAMVFSLATQSDGKIIVGGNFTGVGGKYRGGFARLNPDGSLDTSFKAGVDGLVQNAAIQADGKILVAGNFGQCQGYARSSLARLNPDGSLDTAFNPPLGADIVYQALPLPDGKIMITGYLEDPNTHGYTPAVRLNSNGTRDTSFDASGFNIPGSEGTHGSRIAVAGTNYIVAGTYSTDTVEEGFGYLARLTGSGAVDTTFGPSNTAPLHIQIMDGRVQDLFLQPDGKIAISGGFSHLIDGSATPPERRAIARFSANGVLDNTFTPSLTPPAGANYIILAAMARQPNGKILIEQNFFNNDTFVSTQVARLNSNGSLDPAFILGNPANGFFWDGNSILRLPGGKALIGGNFSSYNGTPAWSLVRIFAGPANFSPGALYLLLEN
jgi:uncharacterized delta-60 repeat protein